jgi:hypothetical protein
LNQDEINVIMNHFDKDHDRQVDVREFVKAIEDIGMQDYSENRDLYRGTSVSIDRQAMK